MLPGDLIVVKRTEYPMVTSKPRTSGDARLMRMPKVGDKMLHSLGYIGRLKPKEILLVLQVTGDFIFVVGSLVGWIWMECCVQSLELQFKTRLS